MKLVNKTILITGGTSGIGRTLASDLLERGNTVIITGRDLARLQQTKSELPNLHIFQSDVSDPAQIETLFEAVTAQFPHLDVLINNAGIMRNLNMHAQRDLYDVTREIEINLNGPIRMIQQFLPHLKTQKNAAIVTISSGLAFIPYPLSPVYSASKAAIHSFTQVLRIQLEGSSVAVIEVAPPAVETPLLRGEFEEAMKGQKGMEVKELTRRMIAGIEAGKSEIRPGLSNVLKIMSRVAPEFALKLLANATRPAK
jgi:uncharacterized oxidoreductase